MSKISLAIKIVIIVVVIVAAFFGISYLMPGKEPANDAGVSTAGYQAEDLSASQLANREFITLLDKINNIELATDIIESVSRKFEDFSPALPDIPVERPNPFAPVGINSAGGEAILAPEASTSSSRTR